MHSLHTSKLNVPWCSEQSFSGSKVIKTKPRREVGWKNEEVAISPTPLIKHTCRLSVSLSPHATWKSVGMGSVHCSATDAQPPAVQTAHCGIIVGLPLWPGSRRLFTADLRSSRKVRKICITLSSKHSQEASSAPDCPRASQRSLS